MRAVLLATILTAVSIQTVAQEGDVYMILKKVLYDDRLYNIVFTEYKGDPSITFTNGYRAGMKAAFIMSDTTMQHRIENLNYRIADSWGKERHIATMTFIIEKWGNVYLTNNTIDSNMNILIAFDQFTINKQNANFTFHTTSSREKESLKDHYKRVECQLERDKRGKWKVTTLKIDSCSWIDPFK